MTGVRDHGNAPHTMWALWRESGRLYVQPHCVMPSEITAPFDPFSPYDHVGARVPVSEESLPMAEWSVELDQFFASVLNIRWPFAQ